MVFSRIFQFFLCFPCFFVFFHTFGLYETMYMHATLLRKLSVLLVVTTFVLSFPFFRATVRTNSLVRPVPLFFLFAVLHGSLWNK